MAEEAAERAKLLLRRLSPHRQAWTLTAHPNAYGVRPKDPKTTIDQRFPLVRAYVEPPAGIEPATPSLPWNHQEPLCEPPFPQLTPDRWG
jgi:hypothetical protein